MVTLEDIRAARERIRGVAVRTPLIPLPKAEGQRQLWLKAECFQPVGAFKIRGAYNKIASLPDEERRRGVITYSSGNHGQAVAYAARALGIPAVVVMPRNAPNVKFAATEGYGAEIVLVGPASSERQAKAEELAAKHGYAMIPPYNDEQIIAGQGTAGLEIVEDLPEVETVLCPVSGGGLLSGVATAIKLSKPAVKVIGVEPELAADAQASLRSGKLVQWQAEKTSMTICDGLRTQSLGEVPFEHIRRYVDDIVTVSEQEVRDAVRKLALSAHLVIEPSGAASAAAFFFHADELPPARNHVAVLSGGNIAPEMLVEILGKDGERT